MLLFQFLHALFQHIKGTCSLFREKLNFLSTFRFHFLILKKKQTLNVSILPSEAMLGCTQEEMGRTGGLQCASIRCFCLGLSFCVPIMSLSYHYRFDIFSDVVDDEDIFINLHESCVLTFSNNVSVTSSLSHL